MHVPAPPVHDCACCHHVHALTLVPSLDDGLQAARTCVRAQDGLVAVISGLDGCGAGSHQHGQGTDELASATDGSADALLAACLGPRWSCISHQQP